MLGALYALEDSDETAESRETNAIVMLIGVLRVVVTAEESNQMQSVTIGSVALRR